MGKEIRSMASAFLKGMSAFAAFPTAPAPRPAQRRAARGVGRHFAAVGTRMRRACDRAEAAARG